VATRFLLSARVPGRVSFATPFQVVQGEAIFRIYVSVYDHQSDEALPSGVETLFSKRTTVDGHDDKAL
jgi:putative heme iron utilization protein